MWNPWLRDLLLRHKLGLVAGVVLTLAGIVGFVGSPAYSPAPRDFRPAVTPIKVTVKAPAGRLAVSLPGHDLTQVTSVEAVLIKAKFAILTAPTAVNLDAAAPAPPSAPMVTGVDEAPAANPPAPQPMEVAMQTTETPALAEPIAAAPGPVSFFGRATSSVQHLPIPSH